VDTLAQSGVADQLKLQPAGAITSIDPQLTDVLLLCELEAALVSKLTGRS
jgi:hypothetical protein